MKLTVSANYIITLPAKKVDIGYSERVLGESSQALSVSAVSLHIRDDHRAGKLTNSLGRDPKRIGREE